MQGILRRGMPKIEAKDGENKRHYYSRRTADEILLKLSRCTVSYH